MRAPDRMTRPLDEIVKEAVDTFVKAWRPPSADAFGDAAPLVPGPVTAAIGQAGGDPDPIEYYPIECDPDMFECNFRATVRLCKVFERSAASVWGNRVENLKAIESLRRQIEQLQEALKSAPGAVVVLLFTPEITGQDETQLLDDARQRRMLARTHAFMQVLANLRSRCDQLIANPPGQHRLPEHQHDRHAAEAYDLLRRHNIVPIDSSSPTSPFRIMTRLLHEAVTGESTDLERACRKIFKQKS